MFIFSSRRGLAVLVALALWLLATPQLAVADGITLNDLGVQPTGIAWDQDSGKLYVISDQDDRAVVRSFDAQGNPAGEVTFDAQLVSPQALAIHDGSLWIGDVGDAAEQRTSIAVYAVPLATGQQEAKSWELAYPDGAHQALAFAVSGKGRFYVVTGGEKPAIYNTKLSLSPGKLHKLRKVTNAPAGVTDAAFLPDGVTLILRTATGVTAIDGRSFESVGVTTYIEPEGSPSLASLGESVTPVSATELLVGSRTVRREPVPKSETTLTPDVEVAQTEAPAPTDTAPSQTEQPAAEQPSPTSSTAATQPAAPADTSASGVAVSRQGTLLALAAAAVLAVVAGGVAFGLKN